MAGRGLGGPAADWRQETASGRHNPSPPSACKAVVRQKGSFQLEPIINSSALSEQVEGDASLLKDLADTFRADAPRRLEALGAAVEQEDPESLHHYAHSIKGSLAYLHAPRAVAAAAALEECGSRGEMTPAREALTRLQAEVAEVLSALPLLEELTSET